MTITHNFAAIGNGPTLAVRHGESVAYAVTGTFSGTWVFERTNDGGLSWEQIATGTGTQASTNYVNEDAGQAIEVVRFRCSVFASGTVETSITEAEETFQTFENAGGEEVLTLDEDGVTAPLKLRATGDTALAGALSVVGAATVGTTLGVTGLATLTGGAALGAALNQKHGADVASAGTIDLDAATGDWVNVTGTTTITAVTLAEGRQRWVRWDDSLTLTDGASLILPGSPSAPNITTAAGDWTLFIGDAGGVVRVASHIRKNGAPLTFSKSAIRKMYNQHAKIGATAGWVVDAAEDLAILGRVPNSQTAATLIVPLPGINDGDTITGFHLVGRIESGGTTVTVDAELFKHTAAAGAIANASLGAITQVSETSDTKMDNTNTTKTLAAPEQMGADESFYALITGTTGADGQIELQGVSVILTQAP